jgi:hypothetical protein
MSDVSSAPSSPQTAQPPEGKSGPTLKGALWWWPAAAIAATAVVGKLVGWPAAAAAAAAFISLALAIIVRAVQPRWAGVVAFGVAMLVLGGLAGRHAARKSHGREAKPRSSATGTSGKASTGVSLAGAQLVGAYLAGARLVQVNFRGASLTGACLRGADLTGAQFEGADITGADLRGAIGASAARVATGWGSRPSTGACR